MAPCFASNSNFIPFCITPGETTSWAWRQGLVRAKAGLLVWSGTAKHGGKFCKGGDNECAYQALLESKLTKVHYSSHPLDTIGCSISWSLFFVGTWLDMIFSLGTRFRFEKFCSVSLSNFNVYACLVCRKYYQGWGCKSPAYTHNLEIGYHIFINMNMEKVVIIFRCLLLSNEWGVGL